MDSDHSIRKSSWKFQHCQFKQDAACQILNVYVRPSRLEYVEVEETFRRQWLNLHLGSKQCRMKLIQLRQTKNVIRNNSMNCARRLCSGKGFIVFEEALHCCIAWKQFRFFVATQDTSTFPIIRWSGKTTLSFGSTDGGVYVAQPVGHFTDDDHADALILREMHLVEGYSSLVDGYVIEGELKDYEDSCEKSMCSSLYKEMLSIIIIVFQVTFLQQNYVIEITFKIKFKVKDFIQAIKESSCKRRSKLAFENADFEFESRVDTFRDKEIYLVI
ncbi:hypothetical protein Tco_0070898 [Tanacetum coccineum]